MQRNGRISSNMGSLSRIFWRRDFLTFALSQAGQLGRLILTHRERLIQSSFLKIASAAKERRVISFKSSGRYGSSLGVLAICWATVFRRSKRASIVGNSFGKQRETRCGRSAALCCIFLSSSRMTFSSEISSSSALRAWFFEPHNDEAIRPYVC